MVKETFLIIPRFNSIKTLLAFYADYYHTDYSMVLAATCVPTNRCISCDFPSGNDSSALVGAMALPVHFKGALVTMPVWFSRGKAVGYFYKNVLQPIQKAPFFTQYQTLYFQLAIV